MTRFKGSIKGVQAAQAANNQMIAAMQVDGALGEAVRFVTAGAHRFAVQHTVVDTGAWRASHRMTISGLSGRISLDQAAVNPRGGRPAVYGAILEATRGGRYAVYKRTFEDAGPDLLVQAALIIRRGLP